MNATHTILRTVVLPAAVIATCLLGCGADYDDEQENSPVSQVQEAWKVRRACMFDAKFRCMKATNGAHSGLKITWATTSYGYSNLGGRDARRDALDGFRYCWNDWVAAFDVNEDGLGGWCTDVDGLGRTFYQKREELRGIAPTCTDYQYGYWVRGNNSGCNHRDGEGFYTNASMNQAW
jgi:hypothetical protein